MRSYRALFRTPEFTPFLLSFAAFAAAQTIGGLALGTLVFRATGSPLLSAVSMFGPQLAQLLGAAFLLSGADRLPARAILSGLALAFAAATVVLALPGLPVWAVFAVVLAQGLVASLGGGVRGGLLNEILSKDGYVLGRSVFNMLWGLTQMAGFATGGALLALLSPRTCLLLAAALYLTSALVTRLGLTLRPPRSSGRPSVSATWRTNALLWSSRPRRLTYLGLWVPNGLVVGSDSLYVSYAPGAAGTLYAFGALGMFLGDMAVGRLVPPAVRPRLAIPLRLLLAAPYLFFVLRPGVALAAVAVTVASVGFAASLVLQERLMALTPDDLAGQALGLHTTGMAAMQGVGAALAGTLAQLTSPATAMTLMAATSVTVTLTLAALDRHGRRQSAAPGARPGVAPVPAATD
ncbi:MULTISPECIES: membrane protein [unclassified Streptomyces]|uniref:membrane protein n=1 Tax=unclassified Streptomyces TaxID=2593676 RepID=UPI0004CA05F8|nr:MULTISPECIES: membrane protein [unclassified Streptomyces]KOX01786.1 membrane protein [Streptomyces sp. NRRL WC-3723]